MSEKGVCPCCGRHCTSNDLHCDRGREYFQNGANSGVADGENITPKPKGARGVPDIHDQLIRDLRVLNHLMHLQYEGRASQKRILIILKEETVMTQRELTERLGVMPGSVSEILAKLENAGLISRTQHPADRRTTDIRLTDAGETLATEALKQRKERHRLMFSGLTQEEKRELLSLLEKVCTDWESRFRERRESPCPQGEPDPHEKHCGFRGKHGPRPHRGWRNDDGE